MSVCLKLISHRRERGLSKNGSKEDEEVGGHQVRVSVQTRVGFGGWREDPLVGSTYWSCRVHFPAPMPGRSQMLLNLGPGDLMLSSTLLGHLNLHVHNPTHIHML